jgi:2-methylcitrate dehydratase
MNVTVSEKLARYAATLTFADLPAEVVREAKRSLLDTLGVTYGGHASESSAMVLDLVRELGGPAESTVIGTTLKAPCANAALANGAMLRFPDYLDTFFNPAAYASSTHACENIPVALATGEREGRSGKDLIVAIVLGYEIGGRFVDSFKVSTATRGFHHSTIGQYVTPLVAGKMLGLNEKQLAHAVGISGCHGTALQILDSEGEEFCMAKNVAYPFAAQNGITAALLAKKGFTGHRPIIEAKGGFADSVMGGQIDLTHLAEGGDSFKIMKANMKPFAVCSLSTGLAAGTLELVTRHDILPDDVASIRIRASEWCVEHNGDPAKRFPTNKETADHSAPYIAAVAVIERAMGLDQYSDDRYKDPKVHALIDKVTMTPGPELDNLAAVVEIERKDGRTFTARADPPKGDYRNRMTDAEVEAKFRSMARKRLSEKRMTEVIECVSRLETLGNTATLLRMLASEQ